MADSDALRARRARRHKAGDHRLCLPGRCDAAVEEPVTTSRDAVTPGSRGARLWQQMNAGAGLDPAHVVLLEEACRTADRLDKLESQLSGEDRAWLRLKVPDDGGEVEIVVDRLLAEARQQQLALKQLVAQIHAARTADDKPAGQPASTAGGGNLAFLRDAAARRRASPAG